jgi:hypothetical protein
MEQVKILHTASRLTNREHKELIHQALHEQEKRPTGMRRDVDMITNFSIEEFEWK